MAFQAPVGIIHSKMGPAHKPVIIEFKDKMSTSVYVVLAIKDLHAGGSSKPETGQAQTATTKKGLVFLCRQKS